MGSRVLWGRCWEGGGAPALWPWIQILRALRGQPSADDSSASPRDARPVDELLSPSINIKPQSLVKSPQTDIRRAHFKLFDDLLELLRVESEGAPLVVVLDDLHSADLLSAEFLTFVNHQIRSTSLVIVAAFDESFVPLNPDVADSLSKIAREATVMRLRGLEEQEIDEMFETITGVRSMERVTIAVRRASGGNPLFVEELARFLVSGNDPHRPDYSEGFRVPDGVHEIVRHRLGALREEIVQTLSVAAVLGYEFDVDLLAGVLSVDPTDALRGLDEAKRSGLLLEKGVRGRFRFDHPLTRDALYEDLGVAQRIRYHADVAEALRDLRPGDVREHISERAHHLFKAAHEVGADETVQALVKAAEAEEAIGASDQMTRHLKRALIVVKTRNVAPSLRHQVEALLGTRDQESTSLTESTGEFRKEGDYWTVGFGGVTTRHKDVKGIAYLSILLRAPCREFHVLQLVKELEPGSSATQTGLEILDREAKVSYERRAEELRGRISEADSFGDLEAASRARDELQAVSRELSRSLGLRGRPRKEGSSAERARMSVGKAIRSSIDRIARENAPAGDHLRRTIRTGSFCSYNPDLHKIVDWALR